MAVAQAMGGELGAASNLDVHILLRISLEVLLEVESVFSLIAGNEMAVVPQVRFLHLSSKASQRHGLAAFRTTICERVVL